MTRARDGGIWSGNFKDGVMHGHGTYTKMADDSGFEYTGDFVDDKFQGRGSCRQVRTELWTVVCETEFGMNGRWANGSSYVGEFANGVCHGLGTFVWSDMGEYKGCWV